jgi:hypothetical protein
MGLFLELAHSTESRGGITLAIHFWDQLVYSWSWRNLGRVEGLFLKLVSIRKAEMHYYCGIARVGTQKGRPSLEKLHCDHDI